MPLCGITETLSDVESVRVVHDGLVQEFEEAKTNLEAVREKFKPASRPGGGETGAEILDTGTTSDGAEIVDEAIALAQAPEMEEKIEDATAIIEDGNVALAEKAQTAKKMSWWWALILLILGERPRALREV
ncbi:MAG: hypothetical protein K6C96_10125 [Butyrivibrio sp.]|nr:hypothetical protein [Butyrivibrio sp.]